MQKSNEPFSFYFPIQLGCVGLTVYLDENLHVEGEGCASRPHSHHIYELRYVEREECNITVGTEELTLLERSILLTRPHEYHYLSSSVSSSASQYILRFGIEELSPSAPAAKARAKEELFKILEGVRVFSSAEPIGKMLASLDEEMKCRKAGYVRCLQHISALILTELVRLAAPSPTLIFPPEELKYQGLMLTRLEQFFSWRYNEKGIKIDALASDIGLSARHTGRILAEVYGMSFSRKLAEVRIQRAKYQLKSSSLSIEKISDLCGFNNVSYFHMCFKEREGITPLEYRRKSKRKE